MGCPLSRTREGLAFAGLPAYDFQPLRPQQPRSAVGVRAVGLSEHLTATTSKRRSGMTVKRPRAALVAVALVLIVVPGLASAQITRATISGTVRDSSGAVLPGATVTVTNPETNMVRTVVTDVLGYYRVPALEPGTSK